MEIVIFEPMIQLLLSAAIVFNVGTYGDSIYTVQYKDRNFEILSSTPAANASYLAYDEALNLYAISENDPASGLYNFTQGSFTSSGSNGPCYLLKPEGFPFVATADYAAGSITVFNIDDPGTTVPAQSIRYPEGSRIHQLLRIPGTDLLLATDLGLCCIHVLRMSHSTQPLEDLPHLQIPCPGGPRHMVLSKDSSTMYCITELSGEVVAYHIDSQGHLSEFQRIKADQADAHGSADIRISGRYLYASHRLANDGISVFRIRRNGTLTQKSYCHTGRHPRCFVITDNGRRIFVACRDDNSIEVYRRSRLTGKIHHKESELQLPDRPVCLLRKP